MSEPLTLAKWQAWWDRINEIPPWGWRQDPKLEGITEAQFLFLRRCDEMPTTLEGA